MAKCSLCGAEDAEEVVEFTDDRGESYSVPVHYMCVQLLEFEHDAEQQQQLLAWKFYKKLDKTWIKDAPPSVAGAYWLRMDENDTPTILEVWCQERQLRVFEGDADNLSAPPRMKWMSLDDFWEDGYSWQAVAPWVRDESAKQ